MRFWKTRPVPAGTHVGIVVATYNQPLLVTLGSLQAQTFSDFTCLVVHDGPGKEHFERTLKVFQDDHRFEFLETESREKVFGHSCRRRGFSSLLSRRSPPTLLCTTNADNYAVPTFLEALAHAALGTKSGWAICDMVHSHKQWRPMKTVVERGRIDAACWMARAPLVERAGPWCNDFAADWHFLERLNRLAGPPAKVDHTLVVHN